MAKKGIDFPPGDKKGDKSNASPTAVELAYEKAQSRKTGEIKDLLFKNGVANGHASPVATAPDVEVLGRWEDEGGKIVEDSEHGESKVIPPELEHLEKEERELYLKLPKAKQESYLAHVAEVHADKEKEKKTEPAAGAINTQNLDLKLDTTSKIPIVDAATAAAILEKDKAEVREELKKKAAARAAATAPSRAHSDAPTVKISIDAPPEISAEAKQLEAKEQREIDEKITAERLAEAEEGLRILPGMFGATLARSQSEDEEYPAVWRYNRDRRGNDVGEAEPSEPTQIEKSDGTTEKERKVISLAEVEHITREQLKGKAEVTALNITETPEGLQLHAELDAGMMGGKIILNGLIANAGETIAVQGLDIEARGYVKSMIESNLSGFDTAIKNHFEKQYGKSVSSIQVGESGLIVEFEPTSAVTEPEGNIESTLVTEPELSPVPDGTQDWRQRWVGKLGDTISQFGHNVKEDVKTAGRGIKYVATNPLESLHAARTGAERAMGYTKYFMDRNISLNDKGEKLGTDLKALTEGYNKLPFRQKAYLTAALIGGGAAAATAGLPTLASFLAGGMYTQRALGGAGFALNRRKGMEARIAKDPEHWLADKSDTFKNTYAAVLGGAYLGVSAMAGRYATEKVTEWLGNFFGHGTAVATEVVSPPGGAAIASSAAGIDGPPTGAAVVAAPEHPAIPAGHPASADVQATAHAVATGGAPAAGVAAEVAPAAPEIASIEAKAGDGYERMLKHIIDKLPENPPADMKPDSDLAKLFEAKMHPETIDSAIHRLATENEFYKNNGASVQINIGDKMTVTADGNIWVGEDIIAPEGARVTPAFHPEAPIASAEGIKITTTPVEAYQPAEPFISPTGEASAVHHEVPTSEMPPPPAQEIASPESIEKVDITNAPEIPPPPPTPASVIEHLKEWINPNKVPIDPLHGHVFGDSSGAALAYGNDFAARFDAAQEFAKANPNTSVWVQAEKPFLDAEGVLRPYVFEVKYGGFFRGMQILGADGPLDSTHIGAIRPDTFIQQLDK